MIEVKQEVSIKDMNLSEITSILSSDKPSNNIVSMFNLLMVSNFAIKTLKLSNNNFTKEIEQLNQINDDITILIDKNNNIHQKIGQNFNDNLITLAELQYQVIINTKNILDIINKIDVINKNSSDLSFVLLSGVNTINNLCEGILKSCFFIISLYLNEVTDKNKSKEFEEKIKNIYIDLKNFQL